MLRPAEPKVGITGVGFAASVCGGGDCDLQWFRLRIGGRGSVSSGHWFGVLFAAITGGWFIIGSFLTLVDTRATWQLLVALSGGSLALWGVGQFVEASEAVDDVGHVSEPLTQVRLAAAVLLIALGLLTLRARRLRNSGRAAVVAGIVVFVLGILGTVIAATVQSFSVEGDCGPEQVQAGRSECADS